MNRASTGRVGAALRADYPGADIRVRREFGGLAASAYAPGGTLCFSLGDPPGVLAALLCNAPEPAAPRGDGEAAAPIARRTA